VIPVEVVVFNEIGDGHLQLTREFIRNLIHFPFNGLVGGILGNIVYILLGLPLSIAIGASGAVFALGGVPAVMRPRLSVYVFPIPAPLPLWVAVIGGFLILSFFPNVAWQAHLGGLAFGLTIGYFFRKKGADFSFGLSHGLSQLF